MRKLSLAILFVICSIPAHAQFSSTARRIVYASSLPATCNPNTGDVYFKTSATVGPYYCSATNTWTAMTGGGGAGTVTSVATTSPITGGTFTDTGTIACATCATAAGTLTSTALMTGGGAKAVQTPAATATMDASGNISTPGTVSSGVGGSVAGAIDLGQGTAPAVGANVFGWGAPTTMTTSVRLVSPNAVPAANQVMLFPAPTANVSSWTWSNLTLASAQFANQGTTTTVAHGNAAGNPSWGAVVSADLNITTTSCTAPTVVTAISAGAVGTCAYVPLTQNSQSAAYTTVLGDAGKMIYHPTTDDNARTFTIDSNANVAYVVGTCITFINDQNTVTIAITSDTLVLAGAGTTGSRTLAENGVATACKVTSTRWIINGVGLT